MILTRRDDTVTIEGTVDEIRALFDRAQTVTPEVVDLPAVTVSDARRQNTGNVRVSASGERESYHPHTGRRGVDTNGFGFIPGAYVDSYGTVQLSRPEDNPLQGWR